MGVRLLPLGFFSSGYMLIKGCKNINFFVFIIFFYLFLLTMYEKIKLSVILRGLCLMLIQGATSILDPRVANLELSERTEPSTVYYYT